MMERRQKFSILEREKRQAGSIVLAGCGLFLLGTFISGIFGEFASASVSTTSKQSFENFDRLFSQESADRDFEQRYLKMEKLRFEAEESLSRLLKKTPSVDLELRFGELLLQRARDFEQFSMECEVRSQSAKAKTLKEKSRSYYQKGITLQRKILAFNPNHPMVPRVHLALAQSELGLNRKDAAAQHAEKALSEYHRLKQNDSALLGRIWMVRGDAAFELAQAARALESYEKALQIVGSEGGVRSAYIHYKLAWSLYNLKDSDRALQHLDLLFQISSDRLALNQEAVQDFGLFAADLSESAYAKREKAPGIFAHLERKSGAKPAASAISRMAEVLAKNGKRERAIDALMVLIDLNSRDPQNVDRALTIVKWTHSLANKRKLQERYEWLVRSFGPKSNWYVIQGKGSSIQKHAEVVIEKTFREFVVSLHKEVVNETYAERRKEIETVVSELYQLHTESFENPSVEGARVQYYRAEIERSRQRYADAARLYDRYVRIMDTFPASLFAKNDLQLMEDAVWGSVEMWAKAVAKDSLYADDMVVACDRFVDRFPKRKEAPQALLDTAKVEFAKGKTTLAMKRVDRLIESYPKTEQARKGADVLLDLLNKEQDWVNLALTARRLLNSLDQWAAPQDHNKIKKEFDTILVQTELKACETLGDDPARHLEGALCFKNFSQAFPKHERVTVALLKSAELFEKVNDPSGALQALEILVKDHPRSAEAGRAFFQLSDNYEKSFQFDKAVATYEKILEQTQLKDSEKQKIWPRFLGLMASLDMKPQLEKWLADKRTPAELVKTYRDREFQERLADLLREERYAGYGNGRLASERGESLFQDLLKQRDRLDLEFALHLWRIEGNRLSSEGKLGQADEKWMAGLQKFWKGSKNNEVWRAAAKLRLDQAKFWEKSFHSTPLMANPEKKAKLYQKLDEWYAEVAGMRAPDVALEALWAAAELNLAFAAELQAAPVPTELTAQSEQLKVYQNAISQRVGQLKQGSRALRKEVVDRGNRWNLVTPVVLRAVHEAWTELNGVERKTAALQEVEKSLLKFPWSDMPRWVDFSPDVLKWHEWNDSERSLTKQLLGKSRKDAKRAAMVLVYRDPASADSTLASWVETFNERDGVQLRIHSYLGRGDLRRANLFLDQYAQFYGKDPFWEHQVGWMEWQKDRFAEAFAIWAKPAAKGSDQNFRTQYWSLGWNHLYKEMTEGGLSSSDQKRVYGRLNGLAQTEWQRHSLLGLCLAGRMSCEGAYDRASQWSLLERDLEAPYRRAHRDGRDGWRLRTDALVGFVKREAALAQNESDLDMAKRAMSLLSRHEDLGVEILEQESLKKLIDEKARSLRQTSEALALGR